MPGDGGVGGVGQSDFLQAGAPLEHGHLGAGYGRQEALPEHAVDILAQEGGLDGAADEAGPHAQNGHGLFLGLGTRCEQLLLGRAAVVPEGQQLAAVDFGPLLCQPFGDDVGQGQVDVVAAEQDVLTHGHAGERQFTAALGDGDEGEVGGAAADIHHQNEVADGDEPAPVGVALHPGVKRGLRLFEQSDVFEAGLFGGFEGQFARHGVEGSRYRD